MRVVHVFVGLAGVGLAALIGTINAASTAVPELELVRAWSVEGPDRFDASGLTVRENRFFVVSDRHQDTIFELEFDGDVARARPFLTFTMPQPAPEVGYLDNEAITAADDGGFYVVSEWGFAVYHVPPEGGVATWVTPSLRTVGETVGLFATRDAFIEGVAVLGDNWFLVAAEREPRGIIEVMGGMPPLRVSVQEMDASNYPPRPGRQLDFSDLLAWKGRVLGLARNQALVVELRRDPDGAWAEGDAWSFRATESVDPYRFTDMTYGMAEGLAADEQFLYVLLDNNAIDRVGRAGDKRSWLFAFRNPFGESR